jgi:hypothetical protein
MCRALAYCRIGFDGDYSALRSLLIPQRCKLGGLGSVTHGSAVPFEATSSEPSSQSKRRGVPEKLSSVCPKCAGFELVDAHTIRCEVLALSFECPINAIHNPKAAESSCSGSGAIVLARPRLVPTAGASLMER